MSDLISRSEVNDVIDELEVYTCGRLNTMKVEVSVLQLQRFINKLKNIPTAYSVDKVVDELEKASKDVSRGYLGKDNNKYHKHYKAVKLSRAIETVKQGGVSDDVCEWKVKSNYYVTECSHDTDVIYGLKQDFKFCPYCGKKIKVVE